RSERVSENRSVSCIILMWVCKGSFATRCDAGPGWGARVWSGATGAAGIVGHAAGLLENATGAALFLCRRQKGGHHRRAMAALRFFPTIGLGEGEQSDRSTIQSQSAERSALIWIKSCRCVVATGPAWRYSPRSAAPKQQPAWP